MIFKTKIKEIQKIDEKDKKIITYLHQNLEISKKQLAKECNISEQNLNYKIQRLEELNILTPLCLFNFRNLGFKHYNIFISRITQAHLEKLRCLDEVSVLIEIFGDKRYLLELISKDIEIFLEENLQNCEFELVELSRDIICDQNIYDIKYNQSLMNKSQIFKKIDKTIEKNTQLSKETKLVILELSKNPKHTILSLSQVMNLHRQTIQKYLHILSHRNILYKRISAVNYFALGFKEYILQFHFEQQDKQFLIKYLQSIRQISLFSISHQQIICYLTCTNFRELSDIVKNVEISFEKINVMYFETLNVLKIENIPKVVREELIK